MWWGIRTGVTVLVHNFKTLLHDAISKINKFYQLNCAPPTDTGHIKNRMSLLSHSFIFLNNENTF